MNAYKKTAFSLVTLIILGITALVAFHTQAARTQPRKLRPQIDKTQFPIADYVAPEPSDNGERARRRARSKKYDKSAWEIYPASRNDLTVRTHSDVELLPALPTVQSSVVIIGTVDKANAYLSDDKTGVYSEFNIRIEEILKTDKASLSSGNSLMAIREGGQVKFPSGHTQVFFAAKERMPRVGRRYVLFLKCTDEAGVFNLLTGYELRAGKVFPLDEPKQFSIYQNVDEDPFINEVKGSLQTQ
ncbi:MAG TPA: hypothetical protein VJS44_07285 [Pyrinomonadaceae bacterium]|nr:hypothetical protein [Pyrinomonadaceae bacterium]